MAAKARNAKAGWKCPKCGREFAQKSPYHGCGNYTVEGYLAGKNAAGVALFNMLAKEAREFEGVILSAAKTQISFRVRSNFMMVSVAGAALTGYLFLAQATPKPYFKKIVAASSRRHVHVFRIADTERLRDLMSLLPGAIELVSDDEAKPVAEKRGSSIGDEINALYRQERTTRPKGIASNRSRQ